MKTYPDGILDIRQRIQEITSLPFSPLQKQKELSANPEENDFGKSLAKARELLGKTESSANPSLEAIINAQANANGLDPDLVKAVVKAESNFKTNAVSPKGAQGLMQLMPATSNMLGVENPYDAQQNITGGTKYLGDMLQNFGQLDMALAAYNAGPETVKRYGGVPPYPETKKYIRQVGKYYQDFKGSH